MMKSLLSLMTALMTTVIFFFSSSVNAFSAEKSHQVNGWSGNSHFWFSQESQVIRVDASKNNWESFSVSLNGLNLLDNPVVSLTMKSATSLRVQFEITDGQHSFPGTALENSINGATDFQTLNLNFSEQAQSFEQGAELFLIITLNPGQNFNGTVFFKDFARMSSEKSEAASNASNTSSTSVFPNPAHDYVNVTVPGFNYNTLTVYDFNGKEQVRMSVDSMTESVVRVDLNGMAAGTYFISLTGFESNLTTKLIVE